MLRRFQIRPITNDPSLGPLAEINIEGGGVLRTGAVADHLLRDWHGYRMTISVA